MDEDDLATFAAPLKTRDDAADPRVEARLQQALEEIAVTGRSRYPEIDAAIAMRAQQVAAVRQATDMRAAEPAPRRLQAGEPRRELAAGPPQGIDPERGWPSHTPGMRLPGSRSQ
jgi:hypothetical protein